MIKNKASLQGRLACMEQAANLLDWDCFERPEPIDLYEISEQIYAINQGWA